MQLAILDNGKTNSRELLTEVHELLSTRYDNLTAELITTPSAFKPAPESALTEVEPYNSLLTGIGDCGSCSSSSLLDAIQLEKKGIPAAVICTDAFDQSALSVAESQGIPWYPYAIVDHPISSRTEREIDDMARGVLDRVDYLLSPDAREAKN
jgi:hypothetical protein